MIRQAQNDEVERVRALARYRILDTLPEEAYDDITLLATCICQVPGAAIAFLDHDRQWFKSRVGFIPKELPLDASFCIHAVGQGNRLLVIPDTHEDARFVANPLVVHEPHIRFYAGAPLVTNEGVTLGTMCVMDQVPRYLTPDQEHALAALSRQVMTQLTLRQNMVKLYERERHFQLFMDTSPTVAFTKTAQGVYTYVNEPFLRRFRLRREDIIGKTDYDLWPSEAAQTFQDHDALVFAENQMMSLVETVPLPDGQVSSWQSHKFIIEEGNERFLAGVAWDITETMFYEQQLEDYQFKLEGLVAQLEQQRMTDALTGVKNRGALQTSLEEAFAVARRYEAPLAVVMMDVDHFKQLNDTFGHLAGDEVLRRVAQLVSQAARQTDSVARYGGEEFVVILPNTSQEGAYIFAERFRHVIACASWGQHPITISSGVAQLTSQMHSVDQLIAAADQALYTAKRNGRNRVSVAPNSDDDVTSRAFIGSITANSCETLAEAAEFQG